MEPISAGIIAGGAFAGSLLSGWMQSRENRRINAEQLRLAYIQRGDQLRQQAFGNQLAIEDREYAKKMTAREEMLSAPERAMARRQNLINMANSSGR